MNRSSCVVCEITAWGKMGDGGMEVDKKWVWLRCGGRTVSPDIVKPIHMCTIGAW